MDPLAQKWSVAASWVFRDTEYTVSADVQDDVLVVQVEEKLTADQWRGQFEAKREWERANWLNVSDVR